MALHTVPSLGQIGVLPGIYYSIKKKRIEELACHPNHPLKVLQSHVGWGPGDLERFLEDGPWRILPATPEHVFHAGPNLWEEVTGLA
jgi:putative AlgH/UPF0301 family transcriptional regulator